MQLQNIWSQRHRIIRPCVCLLPPDLAAKKAQLNFLKSVVLQRQIYHIMEMGNFTPAAGISLLHKEFKDKLILT